MVIKVYKYQGAGNDFIIINNFHNRVDIDKSAIIKLCDRRFGIGADGLMLIEKSIKYDFKMSFFNSDGSSGMMCGNGGRCIIAFASKIGLNHFDFEAIDGFHTGSVINSANNTSQVRLKMGDVKSISKYLESSYTMNTGADHFVKFSKNVKEIDVISEGREIRYSKDFAPKGVNVNFVESKDDHLFIRTYEKGVEDETLACGTGAVASAIGAYLAGYKCYTKQNDGSIKFNIEVTKTNLTVEFTPILTDREKNLYDFCDIYLTGEATYVFETDIEV